MAEDSLPAIYRAYIECLNEQNWLLLGSFVHEGVRYNGNVISLGGYRAMLEKDYREIPDLRFNIELLVSAPRHVASRLRFHCTPTGRFMGLAVNGRKVSFYENVFYEFENGKIKAVLSIIDKAAIEAQL